MKKFDQNGKCFECCGLSDLITVFLHDGFTKVSSATLPNKSKTIPVALSSCSFILGQKTVGNKNIHEPLLNHMNMSLS